MDYPKKHVQLCSRIMSPTRPNLHQIERTHIYLTLTQHDDDTNSTVDPQALGSSCLNSQILQKQCGLSWGRAGPQSVLFMPQSLIGYRLELLIYMTSSQRIIYRLLFFFQLWYLDRYANIMHFLDVGKQKRSLQNRKGITITLCALILGIYSIFTIVNKIITESNHRRIVESNNPTEPPTPAPTETIETCFHCIIIEPSVQLQQFVHFFC